MSEERKYRFETLQLHVGQEEALEETLPKIKYHMEKPDLIDYFGIELGVPLVVDIEVGTWGKGKTWHGEAHA